jgi:hypothetical protein
MELDAAANECFDLIMGHPKILMIAEWGKRMADDESSRADI